jgi:hypothetical protein
MNSCMMPILLRLLDQDTSVDRLEIRRLTGRMSSLF